MGLRATYVKNSISNVSGWGFTVILSILTTPYIFHKLGYQQYGVFSLVSLVAGYFAFLDFGLGDAVVRFVAHYRALNNSEKLNGIISSIVVLFFGIGIIGGIALALFAKYYALELFRIPSELRTETLGCFYIAAAGFALNLILAVVSRILEAVQRFDISNTISVVVATYINTANVLILLFGYGLQELVLNSALGTIIAIIAYYEAAKKCIPRFTISLHFSTLDIKESFSFGIFTLLTRMSGVISQSVSQLVVGIILGPGAVAIIDIPMKLTSRFQALIGKLALASFPMTAELSATGDIRAIRTVYLRLSRYIYIASSMCFVILVAYAKWILVLWLGADFAENAWPTFIIISLSVFIATLTITPSLVAVGMGNAKFNGLFSCAGTLANICLVYFLTQRLGVFGGALSLLIGSLNAPMFILTIHKRLLLVTTQTYLREVISPVTSVNLCCLLFFFAEKFVVTNTPTFITAVLLSILCMGSVFYFFGLYRDDRQTVESKVLGLFA